MSGNSSMPAPDADAAAPGSISADGSETLVASAERLQVSTRQVPARRVRLERYLVTETHTITVELTQEQVRLVYEPNSDRPSSAGESPENAWKVDGEDQEWLTLHREQVQLSTVVVPVERVRLETYQVTEDEVVTEDVRREQIDTEPSLVDAPDAAAG